MPDTAYEPEVICPHCGHVDRDAWELPLDHDGDSTVEECGNCRELYTIQLHLTTEYSTAQSETPRKKARI